MYDNTSQHKSYSVSIRFTYILLYCALLDKQNVLMKTLQNLNPHN